MTPERLSEIRKKEQQEAAKSLGVWEVHFLDYVDGELLADLKLKEEVVRFIRRYRPDIVFTMDPSYFYFKTLGFVNHSDHRAIGEATLDACFPLARDLFSPSPPTQGRIETPQGQDLLLYSIVPENATFYVDVTETFDDKIGPLPFINPRSATSGKSSRG